MKTTLLFFGQLTDITGCNTIVMEYQGSLSKLKNQLFEKFPSLQFAKYMIAVNNKMVLEDIEIPENATIAFMPPFSGG